MSCLMMTVNVGLDMIILLDNRLYFMVAVI